MTARRVGPSGRKEVVDMLRSCSIDVRPKKGHEERIERSAVKPRSMVDGKREARKGAGVGQSTAR